MRYSDFAWSKSRYVEGYNDCLCWLSTRVRRVKSWVMGEVCFRFYGRWKVEVCGTNGYG